MSKMWTLIVSLVAAIALCVYIASKGGGADQRMKDLQLAVGYGALLITFFIGFVILANLITGEIDLSKLLTESGGGASMSRFQLLVFTFVIGFSFFYIVAAKGQFPNPIPNEVLALLGISATTYGVSKGIQSAGGLKSKNGSSNADGQDGGNNGDGGAGAGGQGGAGAAGAAGGAAGQQNH